MGELRMHALSIHEIRDMFGADTELAGRLRGIASDSFRVPAAEQKPPGLLGKLGPLFRHNPGPVVPDGVPLPSDWEALVRGQHIAPERVEECWQVVDVWVDTLDWGTWTAALSSSELDDLDFSLTRAGLPSWFGLRKLMADDPQLPLRPGMGMRVGYAKNAHVLATLDELTAIIDQVEEPSRQLAHELASYLRQFPAWTTAATQAGRGAPDLFVVWWQNRLMPA